MTMRSMIEAIRITLEDEMARDERVMVLGEDVGTQGGVFRATEGLKARFGGDRVVDTPVAEAGIIGASIGLATAGMIPVPELQFLGFAHQAFHQIGFQLGRFRYRTLGAFPLQVTIRAPYGGAVHAPELHSDAFEAMLANAPGIKIVAPSTAADARGLLTSADVGSVRHRRAELLRAKPAWRLDPMKKLLDSWAGIGLVFVVLAALGAFWASTTV